MLKGETAKTLEPELSKANQKADTRDVTAESSQVEEESSSSFFAAFGVGMQEEKEMSSAFSFGGFGGDSGDVGGNSGNDAQGTSSFSK